MKDQLLEGNYEGSQQQHSQNTDRAGGVGNVLAVSGAGADASPVERAVFGGLAGDGVGARVGAGGERHRGQRGGGASWGTVALKPTSCLQGSPRGVVVAGAE